MPIRFNHTILPSKAPERSAQFTAELLGVAPPRRFGPFHVVEIADAASIDYAAVSGPIHSHHVAFLVSDSEFDRILARLKERGIAFWPDPWRSRPGEINHLYGGRGLYFDDPDGHQLECITAPYAT